MIEDEIHHETIDSSVVTYVRPSESLCADYGFMFVPTKSSSSESSEFLVMIQQVISSASFFTGCLKFIHESSLSLAEFDACHSRHLIYLLFLLLGVMSRVSTALHLHVAHDDITKQLANCDENYKFFNIL